MNYSWQKLITLGIESMLEELELPEQHIARTPERFVKALQEYISGYKDPIKTVLETSFEEVDYDQMIFVNDIPFISHCIHHLAPFAGRMHFAYIPKGKIVGLSKIPRVFDSLSRRLQIQEKLTHQMADTFFETVEPVGCGVVVEATHFCICARGIKKTGSYTRTVALKGSFLSEEKTKNEFLNGAKRLEASLL